MELEIKHITPYLPYNLKIDTSYYDIDDTDYEVEGKCENPIVSGIDLKGENLYCYYTMNNYGRVEQEYAMEHIKPILRPLSDLTKEIEHNIEKFVPYDKLNYKPTIKHVSEYPFNYNDLQFISQYSFQLLIEWHFDVFGLIEKDLAIDINPLK